MTFFLKILIIIVVLLLQLSRASEIFDYTQDNMLNCQQSNQELYIQNTIILHKIDRYIFLLLSPIAIILTLLIIITFIKFKDTQKSPGSILFMLSVSDFFLALHYFMHSIYFLIYDQSPTNSSTFCQINSAISIIFENSEYLLNCAFCWFFILKLKNLLKGYKQKNFVILVNLFVISLFVYIFYLFKGWTGLNLYGLCQVSLIYESYYLFIIFLVIFLGISWHSFTLFRKIVPNNKKFDNNKSQISQFYQYILAIAILLVIQCICDFVIGLNCNNIQNPSLNIFATIGNISNICVPFVLSYLRLKNPLIKQRVKDLLVIMKIFKDQSSLLPKNVENHLFQAFRDSNIKNQQIIQTENQFNNVEQNGLTQSKNILIEQSPQNTQDQSAKISSEVQKDNLNLKQFSVELGKFSFIPALMKQKQKAESDWINKLTSDLRITEIYTMLVGIRTHYEQQDFLKKENIYPDSQNSIKEIIICEDMIRKMLDNNNPNQQISIFKTKMTIYAPEIFKNLIVIDGQEMINFTISLDFEQNVSKIKDACGQADGGRSGEFFFFSYDNKLIIKTMKQEELDTFLENLYQYYQYFNSEQKKDSLITKLYGVYRFQRVDGSGNEDENQIVLIMRNLSSCPSQYIKRIYDLKGSTFQREVSDQQKIKKNNCVLKDKEFWELEQNVWISKQLANRCQKALIADSYFLSQCQLIDYSLLIIKIDWHQYCQDNQCTMESIFKKFNNNNLLIMQSQKEPDMYYHLGIIDYLQKWNLKKNLELKAKNVINLGDKDVSVQEPHYYSERFIQKIVNQIFGSMQVDDQNLSNNIQALNEDVFQ